jgi:hypothetical protein
MWLTRGHGFNRRTWNQPLNQPWTEAPGRGRATTGTGESTNKIREVTALRSSLDPTGHPAYSSPCISPGPTAGALCVPVAKPRKLGLLQSRGTTAKAPALTPRVGRGGQREGRGGAEGAGRLQRPGFPAETLGGRRGAGSQSAALG